MSTTESLGFTKKQRFRSQSLFWSAPAPDFWNPSGSDCRFKIVFVTCLMPEPVPALFPSPQGLVRFCVNVPVSLLSSKVFTYLQAYPKYRLYAYGEGKMAGYLEAGKYSGIPVLFIPGNSGSYKQVRSMASVAVALGSSVGVIFCDTYGTSMACCCRLRFVQFC